MLIKLQNHLKLMYIQQPNYVEQNLAGNFYIQYTKIKQRHMINWKVCDMLEARFSSDIGSPEFEKASFK